MGLDNTVITVVGVVVAAVAALLMAGMIGASERSALDPSLAGRELGWKATMPLGEGLSETLRSIAG